MSTQRSNKILMQAIADRLREIRIREGIKQINAFLDTDIHVGRAECGKSNISVSTLSDLCDYYGVTLEEFFRGVKTK